MIVRLLKLVLQAPEILGALSRANRAVLIDGFETYRVNWEFTKLVIWLHVTAGHEVSQWTAKRLSIDCINDRLQNYPDCPTTEHVTTVAKLIDWAFEDRELRRLRVVPIYNRVATENRQAKWRSGDRSGVRVHHRNGECTRL